MKNGNGNRSAPGSGGRDDDQNSEREEYAATRDPARVAAVLRDWRQNPSAIDLLIEPLDIQPVADELLGNVHSPSPFLDLDRLPEPVIVVLGIAPMIVVCTVARDFVVLGVQRPAYVERAVASLLPFALGRRFVVICSTHVDAGVYLADELLRAGAIVEAVLA